MRKSIYLSTALFGIILSGCGNTYSKSDFPELFLEFKEAAANHLNYTGTQSYDMYEYMENYNLEENEKYDGGRHYFRGVFNKSESLFVEERLTYFALRGGSYNRDYDFYKSWVKDNKENSYFLQSSLDKKSYKKSETTGFDCFDTPSISNLEASPYKKGAPFFIHIGYSYYALYFSYFDSFEELKSYFDNINTCKYDVKGLSDLKNEISFIKNGDEKAFRIRYYSGFESFEDVSIYFKDKQITRIENKNYDIYNAAFSDIVVGSSPTMNDADFYRNKYKEPFIFNNKNGEVPSYMVDNYTLSFTKGDTFSLVNKFDNSIDPANIATSDIENTPQKDLASDKARVNIKFSYDKKYSLFSVPDSHSYRYYSFNQSLSLDLRFDDVREFTDDIDRGKSLELLNYTFPMVADFTLFVDGTQVSLDYKFNENKTYNVVIDCVPKYFNCFAGFVNNFNNYLR